MSSMEQKALTKAEVLEIARPYGLLWPEDENGSIPDIAFEGIRNVVKQWKERVRY